MKKNQPQLRRVRPPLTDEELAAAEQTQSVRDRAAQEKLVDEQEQTRLALAGDPDAMAALAAGASALLGRPVEPDEPAPPEPARERKRNAPKKHAEKTSEDAAARQAAEREAIGKKAYQLMDAAFRKWRSNMKKNPREANRELARDLGGDAAIYLQAGVLRMSDLLDMTMKLTALGKPKEEEVEGAEDYDAEMEVFRNQLRGAK
jgi:hypothetical protein